MKYFALFVVPVVLVVAFTFSTFAFAQSGGGDGQSQNTGGSAGSGSLTNPLNSTSIQGFFLAILDILLVFAIPIVVLFIMYAGFLYVTAQGDETKIRTAHAALTWSIIGGVIILGANLIIGVIQNTVDAL